MLLATGLVLAGGAGAAEYQPNWDSLDSRPIPGWFKDAKFGIFIHWGVYAVPAFAPKGNYAEWYWNRLGTGTGGIESAKETNETLEYHKKTYGSNFVYQDFVPMFKAQMFDPAHWAKVFRQAGAKYVVMTSKHHDGFCMFKSAEANRSWGRPWNSVDVGPQRDLLGDLGEAVRAEGLRMGFYYSLYEWYNPLWRTDQEVFITEHMIPQFKDVVTRYKPSIIFSDGEWDLPAETWRSPALLAWLFNESPVKNEVVVNDRWGKNTRHRHGDYYTTEYGTGMEGTDHAWEENRGMGHSYGFNRNETLEDYRTGRELTLMLIDLVSRGGNLLLNVGPHADGRIPVIMEERLLEIGRWLDLNGEAIYSTRPWRKNRQWSEGEIPKVEYGGTFRVKYDINEVTGLPHNGRAVIEAFFTAKEDTLYAITPRWPDEELILHEVHTTPDTRISLLGFDGLVSWESRDENLVIKRPNPNALSTPSLREQPAFTFKITKVQ